MHLGSISLSLTRIATAVRRALSVFSPASLFASGAPGVWYDLSLTDGTLFQDAAGTTPVTAVEQPVGLVLDKRNASYSVYFDGTGDYLSTPSRTTFNLGTSNFTIESWVYQTTGTLAPILNRRGAEKPEGWLFSAGEFSAHIGGAWRQSVITASVTNNTWIHVALVRNGSVFTLYHNGVSKGTYTNSGAVQDLALPIVIGVGGGTTEALLSGYTSNLRVVIGTALYTTNFTPPTSPLTAVAGTSLLTCGIDWSGNPAITRGGDARADKLNPFTTGTGNHAFQTTSANRPVLSARYNRLTKTEQFDDAAWTKENATIVANSAVAPDGTTTADFFIPGTGNVPHDVFNSAAATVVMDVRHTWKIYAKPAGYNYVTLIGVTGTKRYSVTINLTNGNVTRTNSVLSPTGTSNSVVAAANGYYLVTLTMDAAGTAAYLVAACSPTGMPAQDAALNPVFSGDGTSGIYIWGADLRVANDGINLPPYQRVNTATDYDTAGFPLYLSFNGSTQFLQTDSIDFSSTDKVLVAAGVRKLSDASTAVIAELSDAAGSNAGSFNMTGPGSADQLHFYSFGTAASLSAVTSGYAAPLTSVLTGLGDISGDYTALRVNGAQVAQSADDQGTGSYSFNPLYIGARAGTSLFFNGRLYSLIIAGIKPTDAQILGVETYINSLTRAF